jgi:hypothetical protein
MRKAKGIVGHGNWLKWLRENCPEIDERTAQNWMRISNTKHISDLTSAKNITAAYKAIGIIPEVEAKRRPIGTASIDIFAALLAKFDRGLGPIIDIAHGIDPQDMPTEQRHALLERTKPMVEFVERVRAVEVAQG